jgi:hypothetical protein
MDGESSDVIRAAAVRGAAPGPAWSFALAPGAALWIPDGTDSGRTWLDWLTGIEPPPHGQVFWKGVDWRDRDPAAAAAERGRLGCVFADGGLLANLDMDENVWLPARIHRRADAAEAIEEWARFFGVWPLPAERAPRCASATGANSPGRAPSRAGRRCWCGAPLRGEPAEDAARLRAAVARVRAAGCAVVWLDEDLDAETRAALAPLAVAAPARD